MKKLALIALTAFLGFSCSGDDDNNSTSLNGTTWKLTSVTTYEAVDVNEDGVSSTNFMAETGCFDNSTIVFTSSTMATTNMNVYMFGDECFEFEMAASWVKEGNDVTFSFPGEEASETFTLSGNTLTLNSPDFYEFEIETEQGIDTEVIGATLVYTKQ